MNLSIGIVGLPNVGKSTLFSALTKRQVPAENYPFCTIEPNVGCVAVPDARLQKLAEIENSNKIVYATVDFVDIAGLVAGASKGEGLGNQFLANIRETAAIAQVVRVFDDPNIVHVTGKVDPQSDVKIIDIELQLADLATVQKKVEASRRPAKTGDKKAAAELVLFEKIEAALNEGKSVRDLEFSDEEQPLVSNAFLLTQKPMLYILNLSEDQLSEREEIAKLFAEKLFPSPQSSQIISPHIPSPLRGEGRVRVKQENNPSPQSSPTRGEEELGIISICAKVEAELANLNADETKEFLASYGLSSSALDEVIKAAFLALGMITFLTAGEKEARAWQIKKGMLAPEAAGVIHSDFQKKFIKADIVSFDDFVSAGGWLRAAELGKVRSEGKEYVMKDGEVVIFKHG